MEGAHKKEIKKMKRIVLIAPLLGMAMMVGAQDIAYKVHGGINVIPGSATISGKSYLLKEDVAFDNRYDETISILDGGFNTVTEFRPAIPKQHVVWHEETAVSSLKASDLYSIIDAYEYFTYDTTQPIEAADTIMNIKTADDLATCLNKFEGTSGDYVAFTDYKGRPSAINNHEYYGDNYHYYLYPQYGKALPYDYYAIDGDKVVEVHITYDQNLEKLNNLDQSALSWVPIDSTYNSYDDYGESVPLYFYDLDKGEGSFDTEPFYLSQNIFNSDEKWEYLAEEYDSSLGNGDATTTSNVSGFNDWTINKEGFITFKRTYYDSPFHSWNCVNIMSQDGTVLSTLPNVSRKSLYLYRFGGKIYIKANVSEKADDGYEYYDVLYLVEPTASSVKEVSRSRMMVSPTIVNKGEDVNITFDDDTHNSKLTITDASGRVMSTGQLADGVKNTSVSTSKLAKGVYNISMTKFGNRSNTHRIIVK